MNYLRRLRYVATLSVVLCIRGIIQFSVKYVEFFFTNEEAIGMRFNKFLGST